MFDLDARIQLWREDFLGDGAFDASDIDELESHLRESFESLLTKGLSSAEAFLIAERRLGDRRQLRIDYVRAHSFGQILRTRTTASVALLVVFLVALLVPIGVYALADLVSESGTWLIRAREGASLYVGNDGLYIEDGNAGLINPTPLLALFGVAFGVLTYFALAGWGLVWQAANITGSPKQPASLHVW